MEIYILDYSFLSADGMAIFELVLGKVDLGDGSLVLDLMNGPFNMGFCAAAHDSSERVFAKEEREVK